MKRTIEILLRLVAPPARLVALLLATLAAGEAWADADYINANFYYMNSGNAYTAVTMNNDQSDSNNSDSEGWSSYAVQGKYWNDVDIGSSAAQSVKTYDSSAGSTSESSVTVTISGSRGGYFSASGFDHHILSGYIDDNENNTSPLVTFANIPFDYYKVVVYFAADSASTRFGYITLNDTVNLYGDGTGTDIGIDADGWGGCAPHVSKQNNFQPGQNILVSPVLKNTASLTLKVQSRSYFPGATYRSGIAAIQVVKAEAPAACTYTVSEGGTYDLFGSGATSYWSASEPSTGSEAVTISISGDTTLTVNDSRVFSSLTITGSGTLTLAGSGQIITPSVTINSGVTLVKTAGQILPSATVSVPASSTFEIASACTWSGVISGAGAVKVSANSVTFSIANTFSGGLAVSADAIAKTTAGTGFGAVNSTNITVENGGAIDLANSASGGYSITIAGQGVLQDGEYTGSLFSSDALGQNKAQLRGITLTGDALIRCDADKSWGLLKTSYNQTTLALGTHTLTKKGAGDFWFCNVQISGTGKIVIAEGNLTTQYNNTNYASVGNNATIDIEDGATLKMNLSTSPNAGDLKIKTLNCKSGGSVVIGVNRTLTILDSGTFTADGAVTVNGAIYLGSSYAGGAAAYLNVGGNITVGGTIKILYNGYIKQTDPAGKIQINQNGRVYYEYNTTSWTTGNEADVFTGSGTVEIRSSAQLKHTAASTFAGTVKLYARDADSTSYYTAIDGLNFDSDNRPKLVLGSRVYLGKTTTLYVRDLEGKISGYQNQIHAPFGTSTQKYIDTLQTADTEYDGIICKENTDTNSRDVGLIVRGLASESHSLTLSAASTTRTPAKVRDNAKLIFSSTGSWANGDVIVEDGGCLEVQHTRSVASTIDLQAGGTIKIATATQTVNDEDVTTAVGITAGTVKFPDSGMAVIDVSAIPDLSEDDEVTIITATTELDADITKLRLVGKPYSLTRDGNALKVVNDGGLVWDSTNGWGAKDATKYDEATITSPGTVALGGTSLSFDTLTLTGSGTVSFSQTGDETLTVNSLSIASGVTLTAFSGLNLDGATVSMAGTSAYDTSAMIVVPDGVTLAMDGTTVNGNGYTRIIVQSGGTLELTGVTCTAKIYAQNGANVKTYGNCVLNSTAWHLFEYGSTLTVESDNTQLQAEEKGLGGKIIVKSGATFTNARTDALKYDASASAKAEVELWGTLAMGSSRWTLGENNLITLHERSEITGASAADGNFVLNGCTVNAYGNASINANVRAASGTSSIVFVDTGKTLKLTKAFATSSGTGILTKTGSGTLRLEDVMCNSAGQTTEPSLTGSEGTIEFYSKSDHRYLNQPIAFSGHVKFTQGGSKELVVNNATLFSNRPSLEVSGGFTLHSNLSSANAVLAVRNLSGSGSVSPKFADDTVARMVDTLQDANTTFSGKFIHDVVQRTTGDYDRCTGLTVRGDGTSIVHTLELTGDNDTTGPLSVLDYGKVLFSGSTASWKNGTVTIKNNGFLQSDSTAASLAATLTLEDGATIVRGSQPVKATALTALDSAATIKIAFADGVTPEDGMVVLSGTWANAPDAARFAFARSSYSDVYEFVVTDSGVVINEIETNVTVGETEISVGNSWLLAAMQKSYDSGVLPTDMSVATVYLANNGLNGMPRAVSYLLGLENPDDATTAFVMESASASSGEGDTAVLIFTGKSYSTDRATVTYKVFGGDSPDSMSEVIPDSVLDNVLTVTVPTESRVKYYQLKMTVTPK